ncbi:MAG TPA: phosphopantetheine-binding protein [Steroidobacteraceae bacterium]
METRKQVLDRIRAQFPFGLDPAMEVNESSVLADLGLTSLHLLTLMLELQRQYGLDMEALAAAGLPVTMKDLVDMLEARQSG